MHLGRQILAALAGAPDRADWRLCEKAGPDEEEKEAERFKELYKPFDINQAAAAGEGGGGGQE
jgi:hypothetical protein